MKSVTPTGSHAIDLPDDVVEDIDGAVASYWIRGKDMALQRSSHFRFSGPQVSAAIRLQNRLHRDNVRDIWMN
jgi:hypothetical protein